jgi:hypothetical protein
MVNMYALYLAFIPLYSLVIARLHQGYPLRARVFLAKLAVMTATVLAASLPYLVVIGLVTARGITESPPSVEYSERAVEASALHAKLVNVVRFVATYGWVKGIPEVPGIQGFGFSSAYTGDPVLTLSTFYPVLLMSSLAFSMLASRVAAGFHVASLGLAAALLFFMKMVNPPLGEVNRFLYDNVPLFLLLFRTAWKYLQVPYILVLSVVVVTGLSFLQNRVGRRVFHLAMLAILVTHVIYIYPAVLEPGRLVNEAWTVEIPGDYFEVARFLNSQEEQFRVFPLPQSAHPTGYLVYDWGYGGPDLLYTLLRKPLIDKHHNPVLPSWTLGLVSELESLSYSSLDALIDKLGALNVKYVIVRKSVDADNRYIKAWRDPGYYASYLDGVQGARAVMETSNFIVYEITPYCQRVWLAPLPPSQGPKSSPSQDRAPEPVCGEGPGRLLSVEKIDPATWRARVTVDGPSLLVFAESYDPLWEAVVYGDEGAAGKLRPVRVYGALNGFIVNATGELVLEIRYKPQTVFEAALAASIGSLAALAFHVLRAGRRGP